MSRSCINIGGNTTVGQNLGSGIEVYAGKSGASALQFKTLSSLDGTSLAITCDGDNIFLSAATGGGGGGTITGGTNGLGYTGSDICLGGTLTTNTTIGGGTNGITFGSSITDLNQFDINATCMNIILCDDFTNRLSIKSSFFNVDSKGLSVGFGTLSSTASGSLIVADANGRNGGLVSIAMGDRVCIPDNSRGAFVGGGANIIGASPILACTCAFNFSHNGPESGDFTDYGARAVGSYILGGCNQQINASALNSGLLGGSWNYVCAGSGNAAIIGGCRNHIGGGADNVAILGATDITGTTSDTTYMSNLLACGAIICFDNLPACTTETDAVYIDANGKLSCGAAGSGGGGVAVSGVTNDSITTYINATGDICAEPNLKFNGSTLYANGNMSFCSGANRCITQLNTTSAPARYLSLCGQQHHGYQTTGDVKGGGLCIVGGFGNNASQSGSPSTATGGDVCIDGGTAEIGTGDWTGGMVCICGGRGNVNVGSGSGTGGTVQICGGSGDVNGRIRLGGLPACITETCVVFIDASGNLSTGVAAAGGSGTVTSVTAGEGMTQTGTATINPTLNVVSHAGSAGFIGKMCITASAIGVCLGTTNLTAYRGDCGNAAYTHSIDNTQAHSDYLINNGNDSTSGCLTALAFCATTAFRATGAGLRFCGGTGCGTAVDWIGTSDCRIKKCIEPIESALSKVEALCGVCYELCEDGSEDMGLIAQDVLHVEPRLVSHSEPIEEYKKYGVEDELLGLKYDKFAPLFVEAIKELKKQNENLQKQNESLQNQINELKNK